MPSYRYMQSISYRLFIPVELLLLYLAGFVVGIGAWFKESGISEGKEEQKTIWH